MVIEPFKIHFRSLGCKVNLADLAQVVAGLPADRFRLTNEIDGSDMVLLNTCTVTHKADRDARKIIGALRRDHPGLPVLVTGCAAVSQAGVFSKYENVHSVVAPGKPSRLAAEIAALAGSRPGSSPDRRETIACSPYLRLGRRRAVVKVQDGCNAGCRYCVLPRVRGRERSIAPERVIETIERYISAGHAEIVLSGVHLGRYGRGLGGDINLAALITKLGPLYRRLGPGYRLRLSSIEPREWTPDLLAAIDSCPFVCRHFHIPLQSGDDEVLARMGRPYRRGRFRELVEQIRARWPDAAIGSDVMAGFPGESDSAAERTQEFIEDLQLDYLHVFTFSARPGTAAERLPGRPPASVVAGRAAALRKTGRLSWRRFLNLGIGHKLRVLLENTKDGWLLGRSDAYRPVMVPAGEAEAGMMIGLEAKNLERDRLVGVTFGLDEWNDRYESPR